MLSSLHIENVAVLKSVDLDLASGFSSFTGETGAGKSMIIDSINFLLGNRADRDMLRRGESRALVSAVFSALDVAALERLAALGIECEEDGCLLVQRTLTADGHSAVRINGRPATFALLREITPTLLQIHGQNDNRTLAAPENYVRILDNYADDGEELSAYRALYDELVALRREVKALTVEEGERLRTLEMLRYQIADIDAVSPKAGEEEKLEAKRKYLQNAERIEKNTSFAYRALKGSEKGSVTFLLSRTSQALAALADVLPEAEGYITALDECRWRIDDIAERVEEMGGESEGDPTELLNRVEKRLDAISRLCRKYGGDIDKILTFRAEAQARLDALESADDRRAALEKQEAALTERTENAAKRLRLVRQEAAARLSRAVVENLVFLDMPRVRFEVCVSPRSESGVPLFDRNGADTVDFSLSTNPGEPPMPLSKIASGGELSRIMLALKSVIADKDGIATVIYDEIDAGVSGKTARKIGMKLRDIAKNMQILCVTHSAQIASLAHHHFLIEKKEADGRAETEVRPLDREGRVAELARILGGLSVTDAQRRAALDMLDQRD